MRKIILLILVVLIGINVEAVTFSFSADQDFLDTSVNMVNFWEKNGRPQEKINIVASRIVNANRLDKRIVVHYDTSDIINASSGIFTKNITVYKGILPFVDNDDELAAIISHEISHSIDAYKGAGYVIGTKFNSKSYEFKSDLNGIDMMVKAGYNPIAMITLMNKTFPESFWDFGIFISHPKTSRRLMEQYKYIYKKYPQYLQSDMTQNVFYQNWTYTAQKDIQAFKLKEKKRAMKRDML